jgi:hypothetical protein
VNNALSIEHQVALKLIFGDMTFARRYIGAAITHAGEGQAHVLMFGMSRYLSLYIHESHKALETVAPELANLLAVENADIIERARHTVKLFDDTGQVGGAVGVISQFGTIAEVHRGFFLDNTWFPPAKVLETDMAVYHYRSRLLATTATIAFHHGLPPELINDDDAMNQALLSLSMGQTVYVRGIAEAASWQGPSFMDVSDLRALTNEDIRSSKFYAGLFDPGLSNEAKAALVAFQCSMNFMALIVAEEPNPASAEAVFKLKLVTLYHVLSSLAKFKAAFGASLTPTSSSAVDAILGHPTTTLLTDGSKKGLRNTLMHYIPRGPAVAQLAMDRPLCGLVEAYYPNLDFAGMTKLVDEHTKLVAELLDDWSARG